MLLEANHDIRMLAGWKIPLLSQTEDSGRHVGISPMRMQDRSALSDPP